MYEIRSSETFRSGRAPRPGRPVRPASSSGSRSTGADTVACDSSAGDRLHADLLPRISFFGGSSPRELLPQLIQDRLPDWAKIAEGEPVPLTASPAQRRAYASFAEAVHPLREWFTAETVPAFTPNFTTTCRDEILPLLGEAHDEYVLTAPASHNEVTCARSRTQGGLRALAYASAHPEVDFGKLAAALGPYVIDYMNNPGAVSTEETHHLPHLREDGEYGAAHHLTGEFAVLQSLAETRRRIPREALPAFRRQMQGLLDLFAAPQKPTLAHVEVVYEAHPTLNNIVDKLIGNTEGVSEAPRDPLVAQYTAFVAEPYEPRPERADPNRLPSLLSPDRHAIAALARANRRAASRERRAAGVYVPKSGSVLVPIALTVGCTATAIGVTGCIVQQLMKSNVSVAAAGPPTHPPATGADGPADDPHGANPK